MDSPVKPKHPLRQWVEKRWPVAPVIRWGSVDEIPGGTRFAYVLGSATLALFVVLVITGVWQLLYYVPTVDHAYDSVMFLRLQVPLGWLIHGLHYWAAQAFIVVMGLHVVRVFIWAAYKKPRELTWLLGVVLLLLGAAFIFTGAILPWDTLGYWAGEVGTSMAGTVPLVGNFLKLLMRGGDTMGQMTLSRAFVVHIAILPALTVFFIVAHIVAFRQFGSVGPWKPKKVEKSGSFWPDQTFKDLLVVALILLGLICLAAFVRAPITGPADPLDNSYSPKPEWNFLFLYEALKAFKGSWEWIGTVVIPTLLVLLLFAVPFIDRNEKKNPFQRPIAMLSGFMFVAVILVMTFIGYYSGSSGNAPAASASTNQTAAASASVATPATPAAAPSVSTNSRAAAVTAFAPTNQVHTPTASAATPAAPLISTNALATSSAAPHQPIKLPHPQLPPRLRQRPRQRPRFPQIQRPLLRLLLRRTIRLPPPQLPPPPRQRPRQRFQFRRAHPLLPQLLRRRPIKLPHLHPPPPLQPRPSQTPFHPKRMPSQAMLRNQRTKAPLTFMMCCRSSRSVAPDVTTRRSGFTTGWITHPPTPIATRSGGGFGTVRKAGITRRRCRCLAVPNQWPSPPRNG